MMYQGLLLHAILPLPRCLFNLEWPEADSTWRICFHLLDLYRGLCSWFSPGSLACFCIYIICPTIRSLCFYPLGVAVCRSQGAHRGLRGPCHCKFKPFGYAVTWSWLFGSLTLLFERCLQFLGIDPGGLTSPGIYKVFLSVFGNRFLPITWVATILSVLYQSNLGASEAFGNVQEVCLVWTLT